MIHITTNLPVGKGKSQEEIREDLTKKLTRHTFKDQLWIRFLIVLILLGVFAYGHQLITGLGLTAMRDYSSWGIYIAHFVFFVAVSLVGSLISGILVLTDFKWGKPLSRISEIIAVAAIALAGATIVIDMGRPDRVLNLVLHGRLQSPIVWDFTVVNVYLILSLILIYLPLIPDIALLRDRLTNIPKWQKKTYEALALGWQGTTEQWKNLRKAIFAMIVLIMPVAFSIHTVTSWLFAVNSRAGWNSTIFGPYFLSGAFMAGAAAVIIAMYFFRRNMKLQDYFTDAHFDMMSKLLVLTSLVYFYFNINEFLVPGYKWQKLEGAHLAELFHGHFAPVFWPTMILGMILPIILLLFKPLRKPLPAMVIALLVLIGGWLKRVLIVIPTQFEPTFPIQNVPVSFKTYIPTYTEIMIVVGTIALALLIITVFVRLFPIVPVWEVEMENGFINIENEKK